MEIRRLRLLWFALRNPTLTALVLTQRLERKLEERTRENANRPADLRDLRRGRVREKGRNDR